VTAGRALKLTGGVLAFLAVVAASAFAIYDLRHFQPRRAQIDALLAAAHPLDREPPLALLALQEFERADRAACRTTQLLSTEIDIEELRRGANRLVHALMWLQLANLHLSHEEQMLLDRSRTYFGQGAVGYAEGAHRRFGRPLDALTDIELAQLVVVARWPRRLQAPEQADLVRIAAQRLLEQARAARTLSRS
jgi:hypothetical protein